MPVLRLQAVGDASLHLLAAPQEPAAVPGQLFPGATPVLLLLFTAAGKELLHAVAEPNLTGREESNRPSLLSQTEHVPMVTLVFAPHTHIFVFCHHGGVGLMATELVVVSVRHHKAPPPDPVS